MESPTQETPELRSSRVSIVIVSQHQIQLLRPSLAAIAARSEPEVSEVIVVECGSQDGSARIDDEFEGITVMRLPRNFGWTRAVNIATRTAKSEYLLLVPNGCQIESDTVQRMLNAIEADSGVGAVCPAGEFYALPKAGEGDLQLRRERAPQEMMDDETSEADRMTGLGAYYSKNFGFMAGLSFWLGRTLRALFSFRLGLAGKLLAGSKVDGL